MLSVRPRAIQASPQNPQNPPSSSLKMSSKFRQKEAAITLVSARQCKKIPGFSSSKKVVLESLCSFHSLMWATFIPIKIGGDKKIHQEVCCNFTDWQMEACSNTSFITSLDGYRLHAEFNWVDTHILQVYCWEKNFGYFSSYHGNKVPRYGKKFPGSSKNAFSYCSKYSLVT